MDVVVIGSCMIDLVCFAERLPKAGETIVGKQFILGHGGKGANQCVCAAKLGANCALIARLGDDFFGKAYLEDLIKNRVNVANITVTSNTPSGIAQISVSENGENHIIIVPGANDLLSIQDIQKAEDYITKSKVILFQFETPLDTTLAGLKFIKERNDQATIIVNGAPALKSVDEDIYRLSTIFCVNESEAETMSGLSVKSVEEAKMAVNKFLSLGCSIVIITLGSEGAVFGSENGDEGHVPALTVSPVDTTGAGDAFIGGLAFFTAKFPNLSLEERIKRACTVASQSVTKEGTQASYPTHQELPANLFLTNSDK